MLDIGIETVSFYGRNSLLYGDKWYYQYFPWREAKILVRKHLKIVEDESFVQHDDVEIDTHDIDYYFLIAAGNEVGFNSTLDFSKHDGFFSTDAKAYNAGSNILETIIRVDEDGTVYVDPSRLKV